MGTAKLTNWCVVRPPLANLLPPELAALIPSHLMGVVEGHERLLKGEEILTSPIVKIEDGKVFTKNTEYTLVGPPRPDFAEFFLKSVRNAGPEVAQDPLVQLIVSRIPAMQN